MLVAGASAGAAVSSGTTRPSSFSPSLPLGQASGWIVSPRFDALVFVLSALVTLVPWLLVDRLGVPSYYILAGVAIASNGPHLASTWSRVYLDGRERFRRPLHYYVLPGLIVAGVGAFLAWDGHDSPWLRTVLFYWASWHFAAQCWGLVKIYQRKHGAVGSVAGWLEKILLFGGTGWCILHRIFTGPWGLFGVPIWHPYPPAWLVNAVGAALAATAGLYVALWLRAAFRGERPDVRRPALVAASVVAFLVPFLLIKDGTAAFAAAAGWHGIQYMGIVWFYNRNRYRSGSDEKSRLMSWISQPGIGRGVAYYSAMLALIGIPYVGIFVASRFTAGTDWDFAAIGLAVWSSLTFWHYYLDGVIWKLRKDKTLTERLAA